MHTANTHLDKDVTMHSHTYREALKRFEREHFGRTADQTLDRLSKLLPWLAESGLNDISNARVGAAIDQYAAVFLKSNPRRHRSPQPLSVNTRNHYRIAVRTMLNKAWQEWEWMTGPPRIRLERAAGQDEARWLTPEEASTLLNACTGRKSHWRQPIAFALATGLRASNVFDLQWRWIDIDRRALIVPARQYKSKQAHRVPLNEDATAILREVLGDHPTHVFTYKGEPIKRIHPRNFKRFCESIGLEGVTFHTTRHTFAAWHLMNGTSIYDLAKLGGWSSVKMLEKTYGHLADDYLAGPAGNIESVLRAAKSGYEKL